VLVFEYVLIIPAIAIAITTIPNIELFFINWYNSVISDYKNTKRQANKVYYKGYILFRIIIDN
jgi:hypothetical protein